MRSIFVVTVWCLSVLAACGTKQANLAEDQSSDGTLRTVLLKEVEYDSNGLPLFVKTLKKRPVDPGDKFTIGVFRDDKPDKTFDIVIKRTHGDLRIPLRIVYDYTGRGFKAGAMIGLILGGTVQDVEDSLKGEDSTEYTRLAVGAFVVPTVIGTAGGFMVGLANSMPSGVEETQKIVLRAQETIVTYTEYEYNALGQLGNMTMYEPETREPIVKTDFHYADDSDMPVAAFVTSYPENKVRVIDRHGTRETERTELRE